MVIRSASAGRYTLAVGDLVLHRCFQVNQGMGLADMRAAKENMSDMYLS